MEVIVNLGEFQFIDKAEIVDKLRALTSKIEGTTFLNYFGADYGEPTYSEALEIYLKEFNTDLVIDWLLPFSSSLDTFKVAFDTLINEMMNYFDCRTVEELRIEAHERFGAVEWLHIDEIVTIYTANINGKQHYYELMEVERLELV